ncbi:hypothetical protein RSAG8_09260, partial [Rhizoctonia solani AG-8 WAC10335]
MAINPTLKLDWTRAHRTPNKAHEAELTVKREMLHIHQALGGSLRCYQVQNSSASNAACAQRSGYMRLGVIEVLPGAKQQCLQCSLCSTIRLYAASHSGFRSHCVPCI